MKRLCLVCVVAVFAGMANAVTYDATGATSEQKAQLRVEAEFTKKWRNGVRLSLSEELRFDMYDRMQGTTAKGLVADATYGPAFGKSYTSVSLAYAHPHFPYLKADGGYTLRILGRKNNVDYNEYLRHRVFFGVTGSYKTELTKIYLRERFICDMRTDSVNLLEKNKYDWVLRSRLGATFTVPGKPVKPYVWVELENTLNAPMYQRKNGRQFISHVRTQAGVKWRLTKMSSLDFYYRFQYGYDRDINITHNKGYIQLTEEKQYLHAVGIAYNLDW